MGHRLLPGADCPSPYDTRPQCRGWLWRAKGCAGPLPRPVTSCQNAVLYKEGGAHLFLILGCSCFVFLSQATSPSASDDHLAQLGQSLCLEAYVNVKLQGKGSEVLDLHIGSLPASVRPSRSSRCETLILTHSGHPFGPNPTSSLQLTGHPK